MINKKVISLVLSLALIVSCFASVASLGVYAIDNTKKTTSLQTSPVVTTTTAEKKMAGTSAWTARTMSDPYPSTYPEWHCACGNVWADPSHNDDTSAPTSDLHYLWGSADKCKNEDGNGCDGTLLKWTTIGRTTAVATVLGYENVYLTDDHAMQGQFTINSGSPASFHLDLNGHTMYRASGRLFRLAAAGASLSVTDTSEAQTGKLWAKNLGATQAAFLSGEFACKANVYGGYVDIDVSADKATSATYAPFATVKAGNVYSIYEGVTIDASGSELDEYTTATGVVEVQGNASGGQGSFYMNGATIIGMQNTGGSGAGITVKTGGIVNAVNSTIKDGSAKTAGNIYVTATTASCPVSTVKMTNCTIENGEATTGTGGNIVVGTTGNKVDVGFSSSTRYVEFTNCTIDGGTAATSGGNIFTTGASSYLSSVFLIDCDVKNGTATANDGGNINAGNYGRVFMNGGTIQNGTAGLRGGNVYVNGNGSRFDQSNAALDSSPNASSLIGGTAQRGGNVYANGGTCNIKNATLTGGTATAGDGGVFFNYGASSVVDSSTITGGTATGLGDTVYIRPAQTFRNGTTITGECYFGTTGISGNRVMTLSGKVVMSDLIIGAPHTAQTNNTYFDNTLAVGGLTSGSDITVTVDYDENYLSFAGQDFADTTAALTRTFASGVTDNIAAYFSTTHTGYEFVNDDGSGHLAVYVPKHTHKIAANSASAVTEGMGQDVVTYTAVTTEAELAAAIAGVEADTPLNIYLDDDIELTEETVATNGASGIAYGLRIPVAGAVVNICLNGHTLSAYDGGEDAATNASQIFQFGAGTTSNYSQLHICDCAEGAAKGGLVSTRTVDSSSAVQYAGIGYIGYQARTYFYDINVTGSASKTAGIIRAATGYFEAYDTVFNNPSTAHDAFYGGAAGSAFKFYGCTMNIANESAVNMTVAVTNAGRATTLKNCTINSTANGDPAVKALGLITLDGTTITAADATPLELAGTATATITNSNLSSTNNVALTAPNNTTANITGGTISSTNNRAFLVSAGATVNVTGGTAITSALDDADNTDATVIINGTFNMTGGSISNTGTEFAFRVTSDTAIATFDNVSFTTAHNRIGNIGTSSVHSSTVTLNNCTASVTDPTVENGGLFYNYAIFNINGGTYTGLDINKAAGVLYNGHVDAVASIYGGAVLNGGTVGTNGGTIWNEGTVNVYGNSTITGGSSNNGGNIYNSSSGVLNVTDSTISNGKSSLNGGNIFANGTVNITNSTITGGETTTTSGKGGNIAVSSANTTVTLTDSTISNGSAKDNGGAMYISNSATTTIVNINGCTFTGNTVLGTSKLGGDMFIGAAIVNIGASETNQTTFTGATSEYRSSTTGYEVFDNSIATNSTGAHITIKDATAVSNLLPRQVGVEGIIIQDTATVGKLYVEAAEFNAYDYEDKLLFDFSDNTATQEVDIYPWRASNLRIDRNDFAKAPSNVTFNLLATDYRLENDGTFYDLIYVTQTRTQCVCGGKAIGVGNHVCDNTVVFTEWYTPDSLPTSGNYYLTNNVDMATKTTTGDLNLDLNGFDIKKTAAVVLFEVPVGKTLNLTDTEGTGSIDGDNIATASDGANILVKGTFNMFDGTIKNGYADGEKGGNVNVKANAVMNMYGGTIKDGNANKGGNVCTDYTTSGTHGVLNMYAGSITGGTATAIGGNLFMYDTSVAYVNGTVTGGTAPETFGPDIYVSYRNDKIGNARAGAQLTVGADAVVGTVDAMYPYTTVTVEDGAQVTTLNYNTFNATRTGISKVAPTTEKQSGENANSAFNNWYLLARGQKKTDGSNWIRFTSLVDSDIESYYAAGYFITIDGEETDMETHDVYKTNYENGVAKQIGDYSLSSDYYFHVDLEFSADDVSAGKTVTIRPYLVDYEGNYYYGATKTVSLAALFPQAGE